MGRKMKFIIPFLSIITFFISLVTVASGVTVKPGKFDHFEVSVPLRITAGQDAEVKLQAMDSFNNTIPSFGETGMEFAVAVTGSAAVNPQSFSSAAFKSGAFSLKVTDKVAETVTLTIMKKGSAIPVVIKEMTVTPAVLASFEVMGPKMAVAGDKFYIQVMAKDSFGNTLVEPMNAENLALSFASASNQKIETVSTEDFSEGAALMTLVSEKTGKVKVEVKDPKTGTAGVSGEITVVSGSAHSFRLNAPGEIMQGEPFGVTLEAVDKFGNAVADYASTGKGVDLTSSGKSKPVRRNIAARTFTDGKATITLTYEGKDKEISLVAAESGRHEKSESRPISVTKPVPAKIEVVTPDTAVAGERFKIQVTVYNQNGNVFKSFKALGNDVFLKTSGKGNLIPKNIKSSDFVNGTAVIEVLYDRSENFTITAATPGMQAPAPPAPPVAEAPAKAEKPVTQAKAVRKPVIEKEEKKVDEAQKKEPEKPVEEKKEAAPPVTAKKSAEIPKPEKVKEEPIKAPKKMASKTVKPVEIASVSLIETEEKTLILIHAPNLSAVGSGVDASVETEGDQIILKIMPGTSKLEKIPQFDSAYVKKITVEEEGKEKATLVKVKLVSPVQYQLKEGKSSIVLTLRH